MPSTANFVMFKGSAKFCLEFIATRFIYVLQEKGIYGIYEIMRLITKMEFVRNKNSEYDQEIPQSQTADKPVVS